MGTFFLKKLILLDVQVVGAKGSNVWSLVFYWDISISDRDLICSWHIRAVKSTIFDKELNLPSKKNATHEESRSVCFGEISWNTLRSVDGRRIYLFWEIQFVYKLCDPKSYNDPLIINSIISNLTTHLIFCYLQKCEMARLIQESCSKIMNEIGNRSCCRSINSAWQWSKASALFFCCLCKYWIHPRKSKGSALKIAWSCAVVALKLVFT